MSNLTSINEFDIVYISLDEPNADENYADLLAIASLIALIRIGSFSKRISNAETASLIALDIAAGDPRYPLSPDPFCPKTVCGEGVQCLTI